MSHIRKIADFLLSTYLFIATASACLVLSTYFLTGQVLQLTPLASLVFFSTLLFYNFHKVSVVFDNTAISVNGITGRLKTISTLTKAISCIAFLGILISILFVRMKVWLAFTPLAVLSVSYSIPVFKMKGEKKRLREIFLVKITTLAFVWSFVTVTLPMIDAGVDIFAASSLSLLAERFLFMFSICIPFEIRDMDQEKKWGNMTLPLYIGVNGSKVLGLVALLAFIFLVSLQNESAILPGSSPVISKLPLCISALVSSLVLLFSQQRSGKYYFRIFVDGMMHLQFVLLLLFNFFQ